MIFQNIITLQNIFSYKKDVKIGIKQAKNVQVAICCLARNCEKKIKHNMASILLLKKYFSAMQIYILENDSTDHTKETLQKYSSMHSYIHLYDFSLCKEAFRNTIDLQKLKSIIHDEEKLLTKIRMMRMSILRDSILYAIKKTAFFPDIVIQIDIDVHSFSVKGILHSLAHYNTWDTICANGRSITFCQNQKSYNLFFDTFSFLPHNTKENKEYFEPRVDNQWIYSSIKKGQPLYPTRSGFGGISIYKYALIRNISYYDSVQLDNFTQCEHVSFYKSLRQQGYKKIYLNPSLLVYYNTFIGALIYAIGARNITYKGPFIKLFIRTLHFILLPIILLLRLFLKKKTNRS